MEGRKCASALPTPHCCHGDDGRKLRRGQLHARLLHAVGRNGAAGEHHDGEIIFGGVGSGMYGMLIFVIVTVFIAGLMWAHAGVPGQEGAGV